MTRRYRNPGLHQLQKDAYLQNHYAWTKRDGTNYVIDVYEFCCARRLPFLLIVQPRRYCTVEINLAPTQMQLTLPGYQFLRGIASEALDRTHAPKKSRYVSFDPEGGIVQGLDFEDAKALCQRIWDYLAESEDAA